MTTYKLGNLTSLLLAVTIVMIPLCYSISFLLVSEPYQYALARCPNGTHKSPSGVCEEVITHTGLPRCPNGFHRSPSGICEAVNSNSNNGNSETDHSNNVAGSHSIVVKMPFSTNTSSLPGQCDQTLWNHVYNPARLQIVDQCKTVSGTIDSIGVEPDGDFHIKLRVDPQFASIINSANINGQFGDLVLEPICQNPVTQPDAMAACANFHQGINIPGVGTHVTVTGSYVHDLEHGGWAEIHLVSSIFTP